MRELTNKKRVFRVMTNERRVLPGVGRMAASEDRGGGHEHVGHQGISLGQVDRGQLVEPITKSVFRSRDLYGPIRGQYSGHVTRKQPIRCQYYLDVKGAATEASAVDSEIPAWAVLTNEKRVLGVLTNERRVLPVLRAPQSLHPSPHRMT